MNEQHTKALYNAKAMVQHVQIVEEDISHRDYDNALATLIDVYAYAGRLANLLEELMD